VRNSRFEIRRLHRSGDSQQVTIPKPYLDVLGLKPGDAMYVYIVGTVLCMRRFDEGGFRQEVVALRSQKSEVRSED
jgi:bifunctional DNA-binding transcriptional regulator/antitoxin component of YhaV-PrlF toxin-antitoxin module